MPEVNYFWDEIEDNVVREYDENNNTIANYTTEPTLYGSVLSQERSGETRFYHFDGQGNTTELTDEPGNVTDTRRYSAYGEIKVITGLTLCVYNFRGAAGYRREINGGTLYIRSRDLDSQHGAWLSADPIGIASGAINTYKAYFVPNGVDPSGHDSLSQEEMDDLKNCECRVFSLEPSLDIEPSTYGYVRCFDNAFVVAENYIKPPHPMFVQCGYDLCVRKHEQHHIRQFEYLCPTACGGLVCGIDLPTPKDQVWVMGVESRCASRVECWAYYDSISCFVDVIKRHKSKENQPCVVAGVRALQKEYAFARDHHMCKYPQWLIDKLNMLGLPYE